MKLFMKIKFLSRQGVFKDRCIKDIFLEDQTKQDSELDSVQQGQGMSPTNETMNNRENMKIVKI